MEKELNKLRKIQKVEAPPFLYTRIEQKIKNLAEDHIPMRLVYNLAISFCLLLAVNVFFVNSSLNKHKANSDLQIVMEDIDINLQNQLDYE